MIFDRCLLRFALLSALLLRSSSFVDLPPTFCVSRVLACYASVWGPEYLWTIALYWGYKIRNLLEKLENLPLLALVTILWSLLVIFWQPNKIRIARQYLDSRHAPLSLSGICSVPLSTAFTSRQRLYTLFRPRSELLL